MSEFRTIRADQPRRALTAAILGTCALGLIATILLVGGARDATRAARATEATIARAEAARQDGQATPARDALQTGDTPQLAQAALQTALQTLADTHQVRVEVMQANQIEQHDGIARLNLAMTATAPETTLGAFLQDVAEHRPALVIDDLTLRRTRGGRGEAARTVSVQLSLYGLMAP